MNDLISRQKTIDAMRELPYGYRGIVWDILNSLPSAQPTEASCWGCNCSKIERLKEQKTFSEMVHLHDTKTNSCDTISRQVAIQAIDDLPNCYNGYSDAYDKACIIGVLEELPSVQPEQKHGRWVKYKNWYACSECGNEMFFAGTYDESQHYCYNCGARMDGETE